MLNVRYKKNEGKLDFRFHIPLPHQLLSHPGIAPFLAEVKACAGAGLAHKDGDLSGFSIPSSEWDNLVKRAVSAGEYAFHKLVVGTFMVRREGCGAKNGLDVNFHQQPFDTAERHWRFILDCGQFTRQVLNRMYWDICPTYGIVAPFPLHVDIETANTCNMNCPMCYRSGMKEIGQMEFDLFRKIVDECAAHDLYSVRLSWRGEALTHPRIKEMIGYATARIPNVSFLTNAFHIDEGMAVSLIEKRLTYVAVSFDGIGKTYEMIRHPAKFEENYRRLARLKELRDASKDRLPRIRLCTVWPAIRENPEAYYGTMKDVSDYIVKNPYINFKGPMQIKEDFICQYPWERIVVAWNGKAQCCTGWNADDIILGNVADRSISEMWHSEIMSRVRETHASGRRMCLSSCAACRHGSKGDDSISIEAIVDRRF